jgi:uncharacterized protein (TIGR02246 family)
MTNPHAVSEYSVTEEAVGGVVKGYCEAWNTHDMRALAELFVDDAHWINIVGMHWPGKPAVVAGHAAYHQTFFRTTGIEMADVEIREISPDVTAAVILLEVDPFTPPDGIARPSSEDRLSLILTKRSGRWLIAHGHNTLIDHGAQRFDPVKTAWPDAAQKSAW